MWVFSYYHPTLHFPVRTSERQVSPTVWVSSFVHHQLTHSLSAHTKTHVWFYPCGYSQISQGTCTKSQPKLTLHTCYTSGHSLRISNVKSKNMIKIFFSLSKPKGWCPSMNWMTVFSEEEKAYLSYLYQAKHTFLGSRWERGKLGLNNYHGCKNQLCH